VVAVTTVQPSESYPWLGNPNHGGVGLTSEPGVGSSGVDAVCGEGRHVDPRGHVLTLRARKMRVPASQSVQPVSSTVCVRPFALAFAS
jgi:hypothetical protein